LCVDTSRQKLPLDAVLDSDLVAFYLPMHTATRLAVPLIERILHARPEAHVCCYGLYAPMNEHLLRSMGVRTVLGGEFEQGLADLADRINRPQPVISLDRLHFITPDRSQLPTLC